MTLRARLLVVLVALVAVGLVAADVVTYAQLRSFLLARVDPELIGTSWAAGRALEVQNNLVAPKRFVHLPAGLPPGARDRSISVVSGPFGEFAQLVGSTGHPYGHPLVALGGEKAPPAPQLPVPLPRPGPSGALLLDAASSGPSPVEYRVLIRPVGAHDLRLEVATPLTDVTDTLGRLLVIEWVVSAAILGGVAVLAWVMVRRELRPLQDMSAAAGAIAAGDLTRRVAPADDRTEVGRLGTALNAMLAEIEEAFGALRRRVG